MQIFDQEFLKKAAKANYNILFTGRKGVGKTKVPLIVLKELGYNPKYLSAAVIEPYLDFVGIPEKANDIFFKMLLPQWLAEGKHDCLFIDEIGRNRPEINNALLELIQFGTMHGKKMGIDFVWAATNPADDKEESYDVHLLDPALKDRFHFWIDVPYGVDSIYFEKKYGVHGSIAVEYWEKQLSEAQQIAFSPRRLDLAVEVYLRGFDLQHVMPNSGDVQFTASQLMSLLEQGDTIESKLNRLHSTKDLEAVAAFISSENNFNAAIPLILENKEFINFFIPLLSEEKITQLSTTYLTVAEEVVSLPNVSADVIKAISDKEGDFRHVVLDHKLEKIYCLENFASSYDAKTSRLNQLDPDLAKMWTPNLDESFGLIDKLEICAAKMHYDLPQNPDDIIELLDQFFLNLSKVSMEVLDTLNGKQALFLIDSNLLARFISRTNKLEDKIKTYSRKDGEGFAAISGLNISSTLHNYPEINNFVEHHLNMKEQKNVGQTKKT